VITMHCTYPDGETSEARYALPMEVAISLYGADWDDDVQRNADGTWLVVVRTPGCETLARGSSLDAALASLA
jgi:hypothetical protein